VVYNALPVPKALPIWRALGCKSPVDVIASSLTLILPVPMDLVSYRMGNIFLVVVLYVMLQAIFMVSYSYVGIVFTLILFLIVCVCVCVCVCTH
jgi:hypothetical protein